MTCPSIRSIGFIATSTRPFQAISTQTRLAWSLPSPALVMVRRNSTRTAAESCGPTWAAVVTDAQTALNLEPSQCKKPPSLLIHYRLHHPGQRI